MNEIEDLLSEWGEVALCFQYLHSFSQRKYRRKYHHYQIPIIVLSTLTGTANFAADSYIPENYQHDILNIVVRKMTANIESTNYTVQAHEAQQ